MAKRRAVKQLRPPRGLQIDRARFVLEYVRTRNATEAYRLAHPTGKVTDKTAATEGSYLLREPEIDRAVQQAAARTLTKAELTATRVLEELRKLAFMDITECFYPQDHPDPKKRGALKHPTEMSEDARRCVASFEVARANLDITDGKRSPEWLHKMKLHDKVKVLEILAKHFALLKDVVQVEGDWEKAAARLASARERGN